MAGPFYFAWAGGTIPSAPTEIITTGSTHGGVVETIAAVGDLNQPTGLQQLQNLASASALQIGQLYFIKGPGIPAGTFFIYTGGNSLNLSAMPTISATSVTVVITKPIVIGDIVAGLSQGSSTINLGNVPSLVPGVYGIAGTGIGQTLAPIPQITGTTTTTQISGNPIEVVSSAFIRYTGGTTATMRTLVAIPSTITGFDSQGNQTNRQSFTVVEQDVTATASGSFPVVITGAPDFNATVITALPASVIASLTGGLQYNINGPGLQIGTTFIAPSAPTDTIQIDLPATDSGVGVILNINGPRVPNEPFDPVKHARFDENVLSVSIEQQEGNFATLNCEVLNPNVGLLSPGRQLWAWLSYDTNWPNGPPNIVPLMNGRLVGVPRRQSGETLELQFLARPDDYNAQRLALANSMQVLPFWDPVWLIQNTNPDVVLEAYSKLWHIDRTTLKVTASDVLQGEDGTISIQENQSFYENFLVAAGQPPLTAVTLTGTVSWDQEGDGLLDVTPAVVGAFGSAGSPFGTLPTFSNQTTAPGGLISCLCGDGLKSDWPKAGTSIGGGWTLSPLNDSSGYPYCYIEDAVRSNNGGWLQPLFYNVSFVGQGGPSQPAPDPNATADQSNVNQFFQPFGQISVSFPVNIYKVRMTLAYKASRKRTETVTAVMTADVQQVLSDPAAADTQTLALTSQYVGEAVDPGGGVPIGNLAQRTYFQTDRGQGSVEHLLLRGRALLRFRSRAVDVTFATDFPTALGLTLRNSVTLFDRRLPGGSATGKIKSYRLIAGDRGQWGEITIGCAIGRGNNSEAVPGVNCYEDGSYMNPGYEVVSGGQAQFLTDELAYETLDNFVVVDDGVDLLNPTLSNMLEECVVTNGLAQQTQALAPFKNATSVIIGSPLNIMRSLTTQCTLVMKPLTGAEFHTDFFPSVSPLAMPKGIDLEGLSAPHS